MEQEANGSGNHQAGENIIHIYGATLEEIRREKYENSRDEFLAQREEFKKEKIRFDLQWSGGERKDVIHSATLCQANRETLLSIASDIEQVIRDNPCDCFITRDILNNIRLDLQGYFLNVKIDHEKTLDILSEIRAESCATRTYWAKIFGCTCLFFLMIHLLHFIFKMALNHHLVG